MPCRIGSWAVKCGVAGSIVMGYARVGAAKAMERLEEFTTGGLRDYLTNRDVPGEDGTSKLAENLSTG